jgi:prevent-host-death family protein
MKLLEMEEATGELSSYAEEVRHEPLVVTRRGKPVMAVVPIENTDLETATLSTDPRFMALIERSRARFKPGTGIPLQDIRRKYGLEPNSGAKPAAEAGRRGRGTPRT